MIYYSYLDFMILKYGRNKISFGEKYQNIFILETELRNKIILIKEKNRLIYLFSSNEYIYVWYYYCSYASNPRVVQVSKQIDKIGFGKILEFVNKSHSSDSEFNNNSDINANDIFAFMNKIIKRNLGV